MHTPFGQHQETWPLGKSNTKHPWFTDFPSLCTSLESSLTVWLAENMKWLLSTCSQNWTFPEVAILGADQKEHSLWGDTWYQTDKPTHAPDGNNNTMSDPSRITPKIRVIDPNLQSLEFFQVVTNSRLFLLYRFSVKFIKYAKNCCLQDGYHTVTYKPHVFRFLFHK